MNAPATRDRLSPGRATWMLAALAAGTACVAAHAATDAARYDTVIRAGLVVDGSGQPPFVGDVGISGDRIVYVGPRAPGKGRVEIDAHGKAVAPGFVNMLA